MSGAKEASPEKYKQLINIIEEVYPELYEKINSILNIKDTKNKKLI
jgi:hypothetical protein